MSPNIKVIDNVISRAYQNHIEDTIGGTEYPWFYEPKITYVVEDSDPNSGFSNGIYFKEGINFEYSKAGSVIIFYCFQGFFADYTISGYRSNE